MQVACVVEAVGLAGLAAVRLDLRRRRARRHAARGTADARRRRADPAGARRRPGSAARQRPARRARLLHRVPPLPRADRAGRRGSAPAARAAGDRRATASRRCSAPGRCTLLRYGHLSLGERLGVAVVARRLGRLEPAAHDGETFGRAPAAAGLDASARSTASGTSSSVRRSTCRATRQARRSGSSPCRPLCSGRARRERPRCSPSRRSARCTATRPDGRSRRRARRCMLRARVAVARGRRGCASPTASASPPTRSSSRCLPRSAAALLGEPAPALGDSPIVSVHLLFDRQLLDPPLAALLGSPAHWVFDRGRLTGHAPERGQYLTVVASGAPDLAATRGRELVELMRARDRRAARPGGAALVAGQPRARRRRSRAARARPRCGRRRDRAAGRRERAGRVDRDRLAGHDGGRHPQRPDGSPPRSDVSTAGAGSRAHEPAIGAGATPCHHPLSA